MSNEKIIFRRVTPTSRREAEAEAIYQLLKVVNEDLKASANEMVCHGVFIDEVPADGEWHHKVKVG